VTLAYRRPFCASHGGSQRRRSATPRAGTARHKIVGTRKSALALAQTELVVQALKKAWPDHEFQIHARDTAAGDVDKVTPFKDMPVKNLWTHELEQLLIEKKLDLLVHSLKGRSSAELLA
jgi:hydroxymethylbilane synthase